jgi:hypothetical protein
MDMLEGMDKGGILEIGQPRLANAMAFCPRSPAHMHPQATAWEVAALCAKVRPVVLVIVVVVVVVAVVLARRFNSFWGWWKGC